MFGLSGILHVRDYVYGLQSQGNTSIFSQESGERAKISYGESKKSYESGSGNQLNDGNVVGKSSKRSSSFATPNPCLTRYRTSTPACPVENALDENKHPPQGHNGLALNYSLWYQHRSFEAHSERYLSLNHNLAPSTSPTVQPKINKHTLRSQGLQELGTQTIDLKLLSKPELLAQSHFSLLSVGTVTTSTGRLPNQAGQSGRKFRRLSPLREHSGLAFCNASPEQRHLAVSKTRKPTRSVLRASKPSGKLSQLAPPDHSLKSVLSPRSGLSEDYTNSAASLGRHRTLSSPELYNSLYPRRPLSRAVSVNCLRYLPPDKERSLYIGVDAHKLLLPWYQHRPSNSTVTYRQSPLEERQIPTMTPYAIFPTRDLENSGFMAPTRLSRAGPTPADGLNGNRHRSSSDVSTAGSHSANVVDVAGGVDIPHSSYKDPAVEKRRCQFFEDLSIDIMQQAEMRRDGLHSSMGPMMNCFQASISNLRDEILVSSDAENSGLYFIFSEKLSILKSVPVDSNTTFFDEAAENVDHPHSVSNKRVNFTQDEHPVGSSGPSGKSSTIDSEPLYRENFWDKFRAMFANCFSTH